MRRAFIAYDDHRRAVFACDERCVGLGEPEKCAAVALRDQGSMMVTQRTRVPMPFPSNTQLLGPALIAKLDAFLNPESTLRHTEVCEGRTSDGRDVLGPASDERDVVRPTTGGHGVVKLIQRQTFPQLYRDYQWQNDSYAAGFPDILKLECQLRASDATTGIGSRDVQDISAWGRKPGRPKLRPGLLDPIMIPGLFRTPQGASQPLLEHHPGMVLQPIAVRVEGLGPTYQSKALRFALPIEYGAIDTRCVDCFGAAALEPFQWLTIANRGGGAGQRRHIPDDGRWPHQFEVWINILRYFANRLNGAGVACPHPDPFVDQGLRQRGEWACADVEMALFSFTYVVERAMKHGTVAVATVARAFTE